MPSPGTSGSVCAGTTRVPTSTSHRVLSVSQLSALPRALQALQSPLPRARVPRPAPPPSRRAASLLTMHPSPHLSSPHPRQGTMGPPPGQPSLTHRASHIVPISPPQSPQKPHHQTGVSSSCNVTSHCARAPQTPPGMSTVVTGATATKQGQGGTHNTANATARGWGHSADFRHVI